MPELTKAEQETFDALAKDYNKITWPYLDDMMEGYKQGELRVVMAGRRTGKSQMTTEHFKKMYEGKFV